jgi:regulator of sigma E protease
MIAIQLFVFIAVLSFLVIIHELGHFLTAKFFKIKVEEFGLGYPPLAKKLFQKWGTEFTLNWIPFGGFVRLKGENGPEETEKTSVAADINQVKASDASATAKRDADAFFSKGKFVRLVVLLAGVFVNFAFGVFAFSFYFSIKGIPEAQPLIAEIAANSPVALAQVPTGVRIIGFEQNGKRTSTPSQTQVIEFVRANYGKTVTLLTTGPCTDAGCDDTTAKYTLKIRTPEETPANQGSLGVTFSPKIYTRFYPWYEMPFRGTVFGFQQTVYLTKLIAGGLASLVSTGAHGQIPKDVSGPVGIFDEARKAGALSGDFWDALNFAGILSVNLAIMNLLPIPALDGGRAFFILVEAAIGKKRIGNVENYLNYAAFALLIGVTILITARDILRVFTRQ